MNKYQIFQLPNLDNTATYNCYVCTGVIFEGEVVLCTYRNNPQHLTITHWNCSRGNLTQDFIQARDNHFLDIDLHQEFHRDRVVREVAAAVINEQPARPGRQEPEAHPQAQEHDREEEKHDQEDEEHEEDQREFAINYYRWFDENVLEAQRRDPFGLPLPQNHGGLPVATDLNLQTVDEQLNQQDTNIRNAIRAEGHARQYNLEQQVDQRRRLQLFAARDIRILTSLRQLPPIDLRDELDRIMAQPEEED